MTDVINGVVRSLAPLVIAWLVKKGLSVEDAGVIAGYIGDAVIAVAAAGFAIWSVLSNLRKKRENESLKVLLDLHKEQLDAANKKLKMRDN